MLTTETFYWNKSIRFFLECCYRPVGGSLYIYIYDGRILESIFCMSLISNLEEKIKIHSVLLNDSDSEANILKVQEGLCASDYILWLVRQQIQNKRCWGKWYEKINLLVNLSMDDKKIFELLFEMEGNLNLIWQF